VHEIFISYSRRDLATVQTLTTALSQQGVTVWLDKSDIQEGDAYDTQIEEAIAQTNVVIVLWSEHSVKSHWVRAEAAYALAKHKLLPISIDRSQPPLQFMQIQTLDFCSWQGSCEDEARLNVFWWIWPNASIVNFPSAGRPPAPQSRLLHLGTRLWPKRMRATTGSPEHLPQVW
jgi:hypothetical protein